jgi:hypothetical protein
VYQAILVLPALIYLYNKRSARILLAAVQAILLVLHATGFYPLQLQQILVLVVSLILLIDPVSNPQLLALVALIGVTPLPVNLPLVALALLVVLALSSKKNQGRVGLYVIIALSLTLILEYFGYPFAGAPLVLMLVGALPFQKWLPDMYSNYKSAGVLVAFTAVVFLNENLASYAAVAPLLLLLGALTTIVGVFQCMISRRFADLFSTIHQIAFGLLLVSASVKELDALFSYLLLPAVISLSVINHVHDSLNEKTGNGMFEFGGLSTVMRVEAASTLATYLVLFSLLSMGAEVLVQMGVEGSIGFILLGCVMLFAAASSLAVFFRSYTLVFEGFSNSSIISGGSQKFAVALVSAGNLLIALVPMWPLLAFSLVSGGKPPQFEALNSLLLIMLVATILSVVVMGGAKPGKIKSWMTGYTTVDDLQGSRGEIFTAWREIFKPVYDIRIPDDGVSQALEKTNPLILLALIVMLAIIGVII